MTDGVAGDARAVLADVNFVAVEEDEEPEHTPAEWSGSFLLTFSDLAAHAFTAWVEETVEVARSFPGVVAAVREDTELILVRGSFDPTALQNHVRAWWWRRLTDATQDRP